MLTLWWILWNLWFDRKMNREERKRERQRQEEKLREEDYVRKRKGERAEKETLLFQRSDGSGDAGAKTSDIWLRPETVKRLKDTIGSESVSIVFLTSLHPKKANEYRQVVVPNDVLEDIAEGAKDMDGVDPGKASGFVACRNNVLKEEYLLLSEKEPEKITIANASWAGDCRSGSCSVCTSREYLQSDEDRYKGHILLVDAGDVEYTSVWPY